MDFSDKLRELRAQKGITQDVAAEAIGTSLRSYKSYELGERLPRNRKTYIDIANFYGVDLNYLLTDEDEHVLKLGESRFIPQYADKDRLLAIARTFFANQDTTYAEKEEMFFRLMDLFYHSSRRRRQRK